jgi:hypothetical protein
MQANAQEITGQRHTTLPKMARLKLTIARRSVRAMIQVLMFRPGYGFPMTTSKKTKPKVTGKKNFIPAQSTVRQTNQN